MAYKFNVGTFNLGGTLDVNAVTGADIELPNSSVDNADLAGSINQDKLAGSIPDSKLNQITTSDKVAGSSVQLVSGGGIENDSGLELVMVSDGIGAEDFNMTLDTLYIGSDGNGGNIRSASVGDFVSRMTGSGLSATNGVLSVSSVPFTSLAALTAGNLLVGNASNQAASVSLSGDVDNVSDSGAVTLSAAQTNISSVKHNSLVIGRVAGNDDINFSDGQITIDTNNVSRITVTDSAVTIQPNVTITGNLTVNGTTTTVNSTTVNITSSLIFEGPADDHETTLDAGTPTQDITVELPQHSASAGGHTVRMAVLADGDTASNYAAAALVTAAEFKLLDGGTSRTTNGLADGDGFIHNNDGTMEMTNVNKIPEYVFGKVTGGDATIASNGNLTIAAGAVEHGMLADDIISGQTELATDGDLADADDMMIHDNDANEVKKVGLDTLRTFFQTGVTADSASKLKRSVNTHTGNGSISDDGAVEYFNITASATATISGNFSQGDMITIKAGSNCSTTNFLNVTSALGASNDFSFDGLSSFKLESAFSSITLVELDGSGSFGIF